MGLGLRWQGLTPLHPVPRVHLLSKRQGLQEAQQQLQGCLCTQAKLQAQRDVLANKLAELGSGDPLPALPLQEDRHSVSSVVSPPHSAPGDTGLGYTGFWWPHAGCLWGNSSHFSPGAGTQRGHCAGDPQEPHLGHLQPQVLGETLGTSSHPALPSHLVKPPSPSAPPVLSCLAPQPRSMLLSSPSPHPAQAPLDPAVPAPGGMTGLALSPSSCHPQCPSSRRCRSRCASRSGTMGPSHAQRCRNC